MMASAASVEFENIYLGGKSHLARPYIFTTLYNLSLSLSLIRQVSGKLRLGAAGFAWKSAKTQQITTVQAQELKPKALWLRAAKDHELRLQYKNGNIIKFDGFPADVFDDLRRTIRDLYRIELEQREMSVRGWNWGQTEFQGNALFFHVANKPLLEVPLSEVTQATVASKNEVAMDFRTILPEDLKADKDLGKDDELVEMRFYLPTQGSKTAPVSPVVDENGDAIMAVDGNDEEKPLNLTADGDEMSSAQQFCDMIKTKADLGMLTGECIVPFHELPFITPRGRYEVEMFDSFMRMHGKSYDYKISYGSVKHLFLLPKPDDIHVMFVIALEPPIRQGQTRYPFLVVQFVRDEDLEVDVRLSEQDLKSKFKGLLKPSYDAPSFEVVSAVFSTMTDVPLTTPQTFKSHYGAAGLKCSMKVNEGFLFMLEDAFLFVPKPTIHMPFNDVAMVIFSRVTGGGSSVSRTFDMKVVLRKGGDYTFSNLNKEEHPLLEAYLRGKKLKVKNEMAAEEALMRQLEASSSEDELDNDDEDRPRKKANTGAAASAAKSGGADDDEDESEDEDYVGGDSDSDVPEEYDEEYSSSGSGSGDDEEGGEDDDDNE